MPEIVEAEVVDNQAEDRFEIRVGGEVAGYIEYRPGAQGELDLVHTQIEDRFEGMGLGSRLVRGTLDELRSRHVAVLPHCPFVRSYIDRHRDYLDLVPAERRAEFDLEPRTTT